MKRGFEIISLIILISLLSISLVSAQVCTDEDGDGYTLEGAANCNNAGYSDCNDNDFTVYPGATEINDGLDNDCNGIVDDALQICTDSDRDGYNVDNSDPQCAVNGQYDCDDSTATVSPARAEIIGNGIDDNCNSLIDEEEELPAVELQPQIECALSSVEWFDCDANVISTAHEGDSVFMVAETNRCSQNSDVEFQLTELNEETSESSFIESVNADYNLDAGASQIFWAGRWAALWEDDGTADPDPEYYFDAAINSLTRSSTELKVLQCETPGCEVTCDLPAGFSSISNSGGSGSSGPFVICNPSWDCSAAEWSECDPATNTVYRDISYCTFTGTGDDQCMAQSQFELKSEESCFAQEEQSQQSRQVRQTPPKKLNSTTSGFPWWILILVLLLLALIGGGLAYYLIKKKKLPKAAAVAGKESEKTPFENPNDLNAVLNYIKLSKQRNVPDEKVVEMLRKSGWKDDQIKFAWAKSVKPQNPK